MSLRRSTPRQAPAPGTVVPGNEARIEALCRDVAHRVRPLFGEMSDDEVLRLARRSVLAALASSSDQLP
jgi:hypothetical protein